MTRFLVDPSGLLDLAVAIRLLAGRVETGDLTRAAGPAAAALATVDPPLAADLGAWCCRLEAFARVVAVVADGFAVTETEVAAAFGPTYGVSGGLARSDTVVATRDLLDALDPDDLEALLVGAPALARLVVDTPLLRAAGTPAAALATIVNSGEPWPVVLAEAHALLAALAPVVRRRLALLDPVLMSAVSSAPVDDRYAASRVLLAAELSRLQARLPALSGDARKAVQARMRWYDSLLTGLVVLRRPDGTALVRPHQLLAFDPRGDGRIVEVFGDLAVARHLAVFVPGTGSGLARYPGTAARLRAFAAAEPDLAVVAWQNADFPDIPLDAVVADAMTVVKGAGSPYAVGSALRAHDLSAAFRDAADRAGPVLRDDVAGLRMAAPMAGQDVTVVGHSYGGSIVGSAEARGLVADRIVHVSSAGGYVAHVEDYAAGDCGTRRFALTDPGDPIRLVQGIGPVGPLGHGLDPDTMPGVIRLASGVQADGLTPVRGHSAMFVPGSTAWRNLLAVMHGDPVQVVGTSGPWSPATPSSGPGAPTCTAPASAW